MNDSQDESAKISQRNTDFRVALSIRNKYTYVHYTARHAAVAAATGRKETGARVTRCFCRADLFHYFIRLNIHEGC